MELSRQVRRMQPDLGRDCGQTSCCGDASENLLDSVDAALVLQFNAGRIASVVCPRAADVNQDNQVDSRDAAIILQIDAGLCCVWGLSEPELP